MTTRSLRALVIGAGWAGEGHTLALRFCGADVAGICARDETVVQAVAQRLSIPHAYTDWRRALDEQRPDIVALATPAALRTEPIAAAAVAGIHIFCDKPLAATAEEAGRILHIVEEAGVRHAYAATHRYDPAAAYIGELVAAGEIGQLRGADFIWRLPWFNPLAPWTWNDSLTSGGGLLNNGHTHVLAILERMTGGKAISAVGQARIARTRAPYAGLRHDARMGPAAPTAEEAAQMEWRACDSDNAYTALHLFALPDGALVPVYTELDLGTAQAGLFDGWYIYGEKGTLVAKDDSVFMLKVFRHEGAELVTLPTPQRLVDAEPQLGDNVMCRWAALARDFVADICGEPHEPYLNFEDGYRHQVMVDAIRQGKGWAAPPTGYTQRRSGNATG
jgi:predicted dehydrogenase